MGETELDKKAEDELGLEPYDLNESLLMMADTPLDTSERAQHTSDSIKLLSRLKTWDWKPLAVV